MAERNYRILLAKDEAGIAALAGAEWTILQTTVREFKSLDTDDDLSFDDIGRVAVNQSGFVALAFKT